LDFLSFKPIPNWLRYMSYSSFLSFHPRPCIQLCQTDRQSEREKEREREREIERETERERERLRERQRERERERRGWQDRMQFVKGIFI
jgi:FtsZ-binding cell division protein ZapB